MAFSLKMISNELLLAYSFYVISRELTNRGLLDMAHLPLSPKLRCSMTLVRGFPIPLSSLGEALLYASTLIIVGSYQFGAP